MAETILEGVFINIPTPIITDILARLPPYAVIRCRCVCKAWLNLISKAVFVNLHLSKSPTCLILLRRYSRPPHSAFFSLVEVEDETDHHGVRPIAGTDRKISGCREHSAMTMIGSSIDGLVCIKEHSYRYCDLIHVYNPIMGEFITVQQPEGERKYSRNAITYGFGISSGKYLLVRIFQEITANTEDSTCHVYTIGGGVWKSIGHAPYLYTYGEHGLFFNGNLHWLIWDNHGPEQICCLDLEKELFQPFPPPPDLEKDNIATLNLYKGYLSVCDNSNTIYSDIVIWVMKEYGIQNSWSKEVVISRDLLDDEYLFFSELVYIIKVFKDGEILLSWKYDDKIFSYDPKRKALQDVSRIGPLNNNNYFDVEATEHVSSIISLKSLGEVNVNKTEAS